MKAIKETPRYRRWLNALNDNGVRDRIVARVQRLAEGNPGNHRRLTRGLCELKIDVGPGFRLYFTERGNSVIVLLAGGDKSTQRNDIRVALSLIDNLTGID